MNKKLWKTKLAAWLHDPAEKALVLMRDKTGHEWGTVADLREAVFGHRGKPEDVLPFVIKGDHYASAADRPQFPREKSDGRFAKWTQVDYTAKPVLKHPLTGTEYDLGNISDIHPEHIKAVSKAHFEDLIVKGVDGVDLQRTFLNFWRFGPKTPDQAGGLRGIWQHLPADTRIPDHSIWSHLDLVSSYAGSLAAGEGEAPALMSVSFGPVQGFIAEARSTSDLWAGSHLLARIAWEGMKVVCEQLGPDAILFPNLRGVPLVDVWLRDEQGLPARNFEEESWAGKNQRSDANALFSAALPNRFVAVVPQSRVECLAAEIETRVCDFAKQLGDQALRRVLDEIDEAADPNLPCFEQLRTQLEGFPEVYWAAVPWSLAEATANDADPDDGRLRTVLSNFYPVGADVGYLDSSGWRVLKAQPIELDGAKFFSPNAGTLYPALYDLLDRVAAAAKSARAFDQSIQHGYRSTLNGEREWLTLERDQLELSPGQRENTLWTRLGKKRPGWVKEGEHLDALNLIKRLWPTLFTEWVEQVLDCSLDRYVVSTHTLALAVSLDRWLQNPGRLSDGIRKELAGGRATAMPRKLLNRLNELRDTHFYEDAKLLCRRLPGRLDEFDEKQSEEQEAKRIGFVNRVRDEVFDGEAPEAYYGLLLFDGDNMGAWLAGSEDKFQKSMLKMWHPSITNSVKSRFTDNRALKDYLESARFTTPSRHRAISEALNQFSLEVARYVVEDCFKGKLIYAGGDDVLGLVCVDDLLPAMTLLRALYSGKSVPSWLARASTGQSHDSARGYVRVQKKLLLTMGEEATGSCGAIVAHHQAPLGYVLRELRAAESRAKNRGGRDAYSLKIIKRGGGDLTLTDKWRVGETDTTEIIFNLMALLSQSGVSRRAAYNSIRWLEQLEESPRAQMLTSMLRYQFKQQGVSNAEDLHVANRLVDHVYSCHADKARDILANYLMVAEFLARETRLQSNKNTTSEQESAA